jgi:hypothetical protein
MDAIGSNKSVSKGQHKPIIYNLPIQPDIERILTDFYTLERKLRDGKVSIRLMHVLIELARSISILNQRNPMIEDAIEAMIMVEHSLITKTGVPVINIDLMDDNDSAYGSPIKQTGNSFLQRLNELMKLYS